VIVKPNGLLILQNNSQRFVLPAAAARYTEVFITKDLRKKAVAKYGGLIKFNYQEDVMKIAVESNDGGKTISDPFARSKGFLIYEVDDKNVFVKEFRTSKRLKTAILENELNDCNAVISRGMPNAFKEELEKQGKKVVITFNSSPRKALNVFLTDQYNSQIARLHS